MEVLKKTEKRLKTVQEEVEVDYIKTSDGREFPLHEKSRAEDWQSKLDRADKFKKLINYKETDLRCYGLDESEFNKAFTFYWDGSLYIDNGLTELQKVYAGYTYRKGVYGYSAQLPAGRYLCIQYLDDSYDKPYYHGYFGTIEKFLKQVQEEFEEHKKYVTNIQNLLKYVELG